VTALSAATPLRYRCPSALPSGPSWCSLHPGRPGRLDGRLRGQRDRDGQLLVNRALLLLAPRSVLAGGRARAGRGAERLARPALPHGRGEQDPLDPPERGEETVRFQLQVNVWTEDPKQGMTLGPTRTSSSIHADHAQGRRDAQGEGPAPRFPSAPSSEPTACSSRSSAGGKAGAICAPPCACSPGSGSPSSCSPPRCSSPRRSRPWRSPRERRVRSAERRQRASPGRHGPAGGIRPGRSAALRTRNARLVRLAGGRKHFEVDVPRDACLGSAKLVATVKTDREQTLQQALETPAGACGS